VTVLRLATGLIVAAGLARSAHAQLSDRGPRFYYVATPGAAPIDARNAAVFKQHIALHLTNVSVDDALAAIGAQSGLHFTYSKDVITLDGTVTVQADYITLAAALADVLDGRAIDVQVSPSGMARLVKRAADERRPQQEGSTVRGRVTDAATGAGVADVALSLTEVLPDSATSANGKGPLRLHAVASAFTVSGRDGRYLMAGIPPATYALSAHRLSYGPKVDTIVVRRDSQVVTVNLRLFPIAQTLHEVVTTATGQEERYKVGNVVATIDADSVVQSAPILNVSDLLAARAPGVTVETSSGAVGAPSLIRIRGLSSIYGSNDPILIVDGVRVNGNMSAAEVINLASNTPATSRLDDIDPNSIEKIEVLKGPSASALYGTDAANGVIVITTKHGIPGPAQWTAEYTHSWKSVPGNFPWLYWGWGKFPGSNAEGGCALVQLPQCVQDSVQRYNPLNNPYTTTIGSAPSNNYDLSVAGGSPTVQYRVAGNVDDQTGVPKLSDYDAYLIQKANGGGSVPGWQLHPNTETDTRLNANVTIQPSSTLDVGFTANVVQQIQLNGGDGIANAVGTQSPNDTTFHPSAVLLNKTTDEITRGFGTLNVRWRPASWVDLHAVGGYDYTSKVDQTVSNITDCASAYACSGITQNTIGIGRSSTAVTSVDVGGTITWPLHGAISAKTSVGEQYNKTETGGVTNNGYLPQGSTTLNNATSIRTTQTAYAAATAGWLVQQEFGLNDRLWVQGALRQDAGSAFGTKLRAPLYPKASASWLLSQEPFFPTNNVLSHVRLRAAYGQSGVQPGAFQAQQVYASSLAIVDGNPIPAYYLTGAGNPYLQPERTAEVEGGADIGLFQDRVMFDVTLYQRRHYDALVSAQLAPSVGGGSYAENVGNVLDEGLEIGLDQLELVRTRDFGWGVNGGIAFNKNDLTTLGNHVLAPNAYGNDIRFVPGYPLFGVWARPLLGYADRDHDGVIGPNDVVVGDSAVYVGSSQPAYEAHWATNIVVFGVIRVNMLFEYQHDLTQTQFGGICANGPQSLGAQSVHAPPGQQALAQYYQLTGQQCLPQVVSFLRFQSAGVSYDLPRRLTQPLHIRSARLEILARNLALWTSYAGKDPEVNSAPGTDAVVDNGVVPQTRDYSFRVIINF